MIEPGRIEGAATVAPLPTRQAVEDWIAELQGDGRGRSDAERIDLIGALERLSCAAAGAQAILTTEFDESQRAAAAAAGVPAARQGRGIAAQVALARRESPHRGERHLGLAKILRREMPRTLAALRSGRITEWKATLIARETACLARDDRRLIDTELGADLDALEAMGERELAHTVRARACALDPASVAERRRQAEADRHTTLRPAPDTMTWFGALLSVKAGVAVHAVLHREADRLRAAGDPRRRGQIMADTLVQRIVSPHLAAVTDGTELPIVLNLVVPDTVLLGDDTAGGHLDDYGPVPGDLLREWIADHLDADLDVWVRRLYARPDTGELVAMDSRARRFTGALARFLRLRDQTCRTRWCDAPIRHLDHAEDNALGGPTAAHNGQGTCEACNYAKEASGWSARPRPGPRHTIETTTPTGHRYRSTPPPIRPLIRPTARPDIRVDLAWAPKVA
ncbi:DUF222 domain-containing protein [Nocardia sp. N13]|uniref:HNH endonuclease signature motif containing protein n=1 Tax=Nocardioides sp. N13(2025) TaxID=3453405 RepID=UPI003F766B67